MIRDITIGQYYPVDSLLHRLDPRVKLFGTMIFIFSLFIKTSLITYLIATIALLAMIKLSNVPLKYILRGLKAIFVLLLFTGIMNMLFTRGDTVYWQWHFITISREGIEKSGFMVVRLIYLVIGSSLMTFTTTANQLTDAIEKAFRPLNRFHIPVHEFAMMMSIALRFIPILTEELDKIMKAQAARCANFEEGNVIQRVQSIVPILIPLFVSAMRRANDLALAMEARCYRGGEGRTKLYPLCYAKRDYAAYIVILLYFIIMIVAKIVCACGV